MSETRFPTAKELVKTGVGASVKATGTLVVTPDMPQPFELHATAVEVVGASGGDYPLQKKRHTLEYLRTIAPAPARQSVPVRVRIRSLISQATHKFFSEKGLCICTYSAITGSDCEGTWARCSR